MEDIHQTIIVNTKYKISSAYINCMYKYCNYKGTIPSLLKKPVNLVATSSMVNLYRVARAARACGDTETTTVFVSDSFPLWKRKIIATVLKCTHLHEI